MAAVRFLSIALPSLGVDDHRRRTPSPEAVMEAARVPCTGLFSAPSCPLAAKDTKQEEEEPDLWVDWDEPAVQQPTVLASPMRSTATLVPHRNGRVDVRIDSLDNLAFWCEFTLPPLPEPGPTEEKNKQATAPTVGELVTGTPVACRGRLTTYAVRADMWAAEQTSLSSHKSVVRVTCKNHDWFWTEFEFLRK